MKVPVLNNVFRCFRKAYAKSPATVLGTVAFLLVGGFAITTRKEAVGNDIPPSGVLSLTAAHTSRSWDNVSTFTCADVISPSGDFTPNAAPMLTWLAGYADGVAALGSLDARFKNVGRMKMRELGPAVLAYCKAKPEMAVSEVTTGIFEILINAQPGDRIDLLLPKTH